MWRAAFHKSGKPRGWLRAVAISKSKRAVRPLFTRVFYKKNGALRPKLAAYSKQMPEYLSSVFQRGENFQSAVSNIQDIGSRIFAEQQAEITPEIAREIINNLTYKPLISVIMPIYNSPIEWLQRAVKSLQCQFYSDWELCIVDDGSPESSARDLILKLSRTDPRIRLSLMVKNGGISAASNKSLEMAGGDFIALVDHDDEITPDALLHMAVQINKTKDVDFLYSDECKIDDSTDRNLFDFIFKPAWSPEIMFNCMLTGHLTIYRTDLVRKIGGFRSEFDFSQDYDLALRMAEVSTKIVHVERVLYLLRAISGSAASGGKNFARATNTAALSDAMIRRGVDATIETKSHANVVRVQIPKDGSKVSIIIPSDSDKNLRLAINSLKKGTKYSNYEVIAVCNSRVAKTLIEEYPDWPNLVFKIYDKVYNFSDKCNAGARKATGDILVFYNDDVFPIQADWLERLIEYLFIPGVGATSPQLLYQNETIQYAGMVSGMPTMASVAYHGRPFGSTDQYQSMNQYVRNVSILSGACLAIKRNLFFEIGEFDAVNTPDGHSDIDLSYKVYKSNLRCVYTPYSLLTHIGNHSWDSKTSKYKADIFLLKRWGIQVSSDPYFSQSMRRALDTDFSQDFRIFAEKNDPRSLYDGPDVLLVTHELSDTGAPRMVLEAAIAIKSFGGFPVVVSPCDGPLRAEFENEAVTVIIDPYARTADPLFIRFARNFDLAIINTVTQKTLFQKIFNISNLKTVWWLHEGQAMEKELSNLSPPEIERISFICVSEYSKRFIPQNANVKVLINGIRDQSNTLRDRDPSEKMRFLILGTVQHRKGQDIFIRAVSQLPSAVRNQCEFIIAGHHPNDHDSFILDIKEYVCNFKEIALLENISHSSVMSLMSTIDVLVCCSRDESFSLVSIEAASMCVPTIFSDMVGAREVLNEDCSLIFPSESISGLRDQMLWAYENRPKMIEFGLKARQVYENFLTDRHFRTRFIEMIMDEIRK
jgi:GT2 family glycosyltransferase/glycosyltransferase involved in cell wall biosynthesis